ncbi:MAG TPA: NAD(P)/FAD-dependent oxidoreductase [Acidimicrobiaceae bacterium]|nr:NAD(P)/FAD-dependent oxidoreductase [Acidimicrobiaceae bacterium]
MTASAATSPSPFVAGVEPITETDEQIAAYLAEAELAPLLPALAYLTGDLSLLRPELRPDPLLVSMPFNGYTDEQQAHIRALALDTLRAYRDGGCVPAPVPADDDLLRMMEWTVGGEGMAAYLPLLEEELAYKGEDRRAPGWTLADVAPGTDLDVVIIGAGMSGILAGHRLNQAGVPYTILDKNDDVGGTWYEAAYPGCRVDNPNHNYSYSFAQRHDWPGYYSAQGTLHQYFRECADAFDVRRHVRFGCRVQRSEWDDVAKKWTVHYTDAAGAMQSITASAVISAVGQLNRPKFPTEIEGFGSFEGIAFHSAQWRHDVDLSGKRVVCIGTGASALQFLPHVAEQASSLVVTQRTPPWLAPTPDYHDAVAGGLKWLYGHVPGYSEFNRFSIFWRMGDGALEAVKVDPEWQSDGSSVNAVSEFTRLTLLEYYKVEFADRPDLLEKVTPHYPPAAKRMVRDNGVWARTLKRPNVTLETQGIRRITPTGIEMDDGTMHECDVLLYGTGYEASKFLTPMEVKGRGGADLHEQWGGDARAYLGVATPGFPNFFMLYGPNTNIVINGSIIYFSECGVRYILNLLELVAREGGRSIEVRRDVHDEFNERCDAENRAMAWGWSSVNSWYKNDHGRVSQNWPFTLLEYWERTRQANPAEFHIS